MSPAVKNAQAVLPYSPAYRKECVVEPVVVWSKYVGHKKVEVLLHGNGLHDSILASPGVFHHQHHRINSRSGETVRGLLSLNLLYGFGAQVQEPVPFVYALSF